MMKNMLVLICAVLLTAGCTHSLRITNEETFKPARTKPDQAVKIGFLYSEDKLINSAITEISLSSAVKEAKKDYRIGSGIEVDYVSELVPRMNFRASGQNFLITFPGFIIFTHAIVGYKYYVDIETQSNLSDPTGKKLSEASISTPYEIRYTSFARGAASSLLGWLLPGFGLMDIFPGAIFAYNYDERATAEFIEKVKPSYSTLVSSKVLEQIAEVQRTNSSGLKHLFKMEPVVIGNERAADVLNGADDRHFMMYVMKVEDGQLNVFTSKTHEVTEQTRQVLEKIAKKEMIPDATNIKNLLYAFGISDMPNMERTIIYTMRNDEIIALFNGNAATLQIANKKKW